MDFTWLPFKEIVIKYTHRQSSGTNGPRFKAQAEHFFEQGMHTDNFTTSDWVSYKKP